MSNYIKGNYTQPFLCITSSKGLSALIEGNTKSAFYEKLLLQVSPKNGNLVVLHCGKDKAYKKQTLLDIYVITWFGTVHLRQHTHVDLVFIYYA